MTLVMAARRCCMRVSKRQMPVSPSALMPVHSANALLQALRPQVAATMAVYLALPAACKPQQALQQQELPWTMSSMQPAVMMMCHGIQWQQQQEVRSAAVVLVTLPCCRRR